MTTRITATMIEGARNVVRELLTFEYPADGVLSHYFRNNREMGARDRSFIAETAYAVLRRKRMLERLCGDKITPQRLVLASLTRIAGYSSRQLGTALDKEETEWLDAIRNTQLSEGTLAEQADLPDWLTERLLAFMSAEEVLALARGNGGRCGSCRG